ncbi:MAG: ABC-2 type transport system permease protein [Flavobacteriales bacterium]|jgi:ABC-2 type transport system permease protein|tara:strand:+ start:38421 stop:39761 length:1341 start_codon:yes stop_codon:yes gene_type:complete
MNKLNLIIKREFKTRVKKKSFIVLSIITPIIIALLVIAPILIQQSTFKQKTVLVVDNTITLGDLLERDKSSKFIKYVNMPLSATIERVADRFENASDTMVLHLNKNFGVISNSPGQLYNNGHPGPGVLKTIKNDCFDIFRKIQVYRVTKLNLEKVDKRLGDSCNIQYEGQGLNPEVKSYLSLAGGFLMYLLVLIYGVQVMKGVMEEKTNRIIEVMLSSIQPVKLMWGKILGIGLVGITQFVIIIITSIIFFGAIQSFVDIDTANLVNDQIKIMDSDGNLVNANLPQLSIEEMDTLYAIEGVKSYLPTFLIIMPFLFIGGFLLYAAFFAAVGSAANPDTETQQFILPITVPIILSMVIATTIMDNPSSDLVYYTSMFPLTSPIVMAARLPFINWATDWWQVLTAILLLFTTVWLSTKFAAKVYKTAILMYGQKLSYRNIWKWFKQSN